MNESESTKIAELFAAVKEDYRTFLSQNSLGKYLRIIEINAIIRALEESNYKQNIAAEKLGISLYSLRSKMDKYSMHLEKIAVGADYLKHSWGCSLDEFLEQVERIIIRIKMDMKATIYNENNEANQNEHKEANQNKHKETDDNRNIDVVMTDKEDALKIIKMIANGEDPYKDEKPAKYLPEHNPKTLRALCKTITDILPTKTEGNDISNRQPLILSNFINKPIEQFFKNLEKDAILKALTKCPLKENEAAEILGISYHDLQNKINEHEIDIGTIEKEAIFQALAEAGWDKFYNAAKLLRITFDKLEQKIDQYGFGKELIIKALLMAIDQDYYKQLKKIDLVQLLEKIEKNAIIKSLEKSSNNKNAAAERLKISFRSLRYRIDKLQTKNIDQVDNSIKSDYFKFFTDISLDEFLQIVEKKLIELALKENQYNQNRASEKLGITFRSIRYRIENLGIKIP